MELIVVVGIVSIITGMLLMGINKARTQYQSVECLLNLRQISQAFEHYAESNNGIFPNPARTGCSWESSLMPYLRDARLLQCPNDGESFPVLGSSYDWRDTPDPFTTMAGQKLANTNRPGAVLAFESMPGWHGRGLMNVVNLDGSACTLDQDTALKDLFIPIRQ